MKTINIIENKSKAKTQSIKEAYGGFKAII